MAREAAKSASQILLTTRLWIISPLESPPDREHLPNYYL
jgi:hypothetical protein